MDITWTKGPKALVAIAVFFSFTFFLTMNKLSRTSVVVPKGDYENVLRHMLRNASVVAGIRDKVAADTKRVAGCREVVVDVRPAELQLEVTVSGSLACAVQVTTTVTQTTRTLFQPLSVLYRSIDNDRPAELKVIAEHAHGDELNFRAISNFPQILTVLIRWPSFTNNNFALANLPVKRYYLRPFPTDPCFDSSETTHCKENLQPEVVFASSQSLSSTSTNTDGVKTDTISPHPAVRANATKTEQIPIYHHMVFNAHVDRLGRVSSGTVDITPHQCKKDHHVNRYRCRWEYFFPSFCSRPVHYDEVFVISQYWGSGFFHRAVESLPRLGPHLEFLRANPSIRIHALGEFEQFAMLGLSPERVVRGEVTAGVAYVPQGGGCGWLNPPAGQILMTQYHDYVTRGFPKDAEALLLLLPSLPSQLEHKRGFPKDAEALAPSLMPSQQLEHKPPPPGLQPAPVPIPRNVVLLIKRTSKRYLDQHDQIVEILSDLVERFNLKLEIFADDPVPEFDAIVRMFYAARVVVAPHGAGLANLMFSQPGTAVIEVLCNPEPNFCYESVCKALGHVYVGLLSTRPLACGPLYVDLPYFQKLAAMVVAHNTQDNAYSSQ